MPKDAERENNRETGSSKRDEDTSNMSAFIGESNAEEFLNCVTKDIWLLDSGASKHIPL